MVARAAGVSLPTVRKAVREADSGPQPSGRVRRPGGGRRKPDLARQEVYALLCLYQAIRHLIVAGAQHAGLDPNRISFTRARDAAARHASDDAAFSPRTTT
jgi:hypothetical protein